MLAIGRVESSWILTLTSFSLSYPSCALSQSAASQINDLCFWGSLPVKSKAFTDLIRYFALEDYLGYVSDTALQSLPASFAKASAEIAISKDRQRASVSVCSQVCGNILLQPSCSSCCYLKFRITSGCVVFIGVGAHVDVIDVATIERSPTCQGFWTSAPCVFEGRRVYGHISPPKRQQTWDSRSSWLLVRADFTSHQLSMYNSMKQTQVDMPLEVAEDKVSMYSFVM